MRQSKMMKVMALMLSMTMITSVFVGNTLSRYVTSVSSTDSARVAVWGINGEEIQMNLFDTKYLVDDKVVAEANNKTDKIIAPGTKGKAEFNIINFEQDVAPEVAYQVSIQLDDSQIADEIKNNPSVQWKLDEGSWGTLEQLKTSILSLSGDASGVHTYAPGQFATAFEDNTPHTIAWQWVMDNSNNIMDTEMGNLALTNDLNAVIKVSITAQQIDDLITNANMLEGANRTVNLQDVQPLSFRSASDINNFERVEVNGEPIDEGTDYTKTEGSTIITLTESYIVSLTADRYVIDIISSDMIASTVFEVVDELVISDVLSENSWETISVVAKLGKAAEYWNVGDKTTVDVNGTDYEVVIADFDHDGDNTITFVFTESVTTAPINSNGLNDGSWKDSEIRNSVIVNILNQMENKDFLKEVEKQTIKGYSDGYIDNSTYDLITTNDKLFLLSYTEVFGGSFNEGTQYEYFKTALNRIIEPDDENKGIWWWLRTPIEVDRYNWYHVYDDGSVYVFSPGNNYGVVPAFVIG